MKIKSLLLLGAFLLCSNSVFALNIDIYANHLNNNGGGSPYSGLVGSFQSPDIMFGYNWHPYGLGVYGADITGYLDVSNSGSYLFDLASDDGSLLLIDSLLVVNNGGPHGPRDAFGTASLTAGLHPFEVQFYEDFGGPGGVNLYLPQGVTYGATPTPEPATMFLLGIGLLGLVGFKKKRK